MSSNAYSGKRFSPIKEVGRNKYYSIHTKTEGFERVQILLDGLPMAIRSSAGFGQVKAAQLFKHRWQEDIRSGGSRYAFKPLSDKYADRKLAAGYDDTPFNLTGSYLRSIKVRWRKDGTVSTEVYPGATAPKVPGITSGKSSRRVIDYIKFVEARRPLLKTSFRAWGGKRKIANIIAYYMKNSKASLATYMRTGKIPSIPKTL